jgi:hypothetical protein
MAINPDNSVLDIINGTLRVSSLDVKQGSSGVSLNVLARNNVLLFDDQKSTTTFMPTTQGGYMSSTGVTRDTTSHYLELGTASDAGWVYWPLQLPNSWHTEFDMHVTTTGGVLTFSLFNTSEPNHTDFTNNDGGYKIVFDNTNNQIVIYWEGSVHKTVSIDLRSNDWQHVNVNYTQGATSVSLAGKVVLTHEFTENYQEFNSRYVGFSATAGTSHKIRHLRVHNGDKWLYTQTTNASDITYVSGNVGIGSLAPTELLDVHGNVHIASDLTVDGNLTVTGTTTYIDTTNATIEDPIIELAKGNTSDTIDAGLIVTRGASNVAIAYRGDEDELAFGYTQSGASGVDVTPIANGGLDVRVYGNLFANNLTTTANVEATYLKGDGSEIAQVTLDQVVGYANTTANTIQLTNSDVGLKATGNVEANYFVGDGSKLTGLVTDLQSVADNGNTCSNTIQFTNATTAFIANSNVGIGTSSPSADLHVVGYQYINNIPTLANSFDHSDAPLTLTHGTATSDTAINDPKPVLHLARDGTTSQSYGARASFNLSRYENSSTHSRSRLDVALADGTYAESTVMTLRSDGKIGVGTVTPAYTLDVNGTANVGDLTATSVTIDDYVVHTGDTDTKIGFPALDTISLTTGGTECMRVDGSGNVGIGTASPLQKLDILTDTGGYGIGLRDSTRDLFQVLKQTNGCSMNMYESGTSMVKLHTNGTSWLNGGNVGIGTNSPGRALEVYTGNGSTPGLRLRRGSGAAYTDLRHADTPDGLAIHTSDGNATTLEVMRVCGANGGRVGIGTDNPSYKLDVLTDTDSDGITLKSSTNGLGYITKSGNGCNFGMNESGVRKVYIRTNADSYFNGGNVGIGTTSPNDRLHVVGNANIYGLISGIHSEQTYGNLGHINLIENTANTGQLRIGVNRAYTYMDTHSSSQYLVLNSTNGGNVGINERTPTEKLHVDGNILASGNITAYSDKRIKSDITKIENSLDKIEKLNGYTYTVKDERYTGLIAQEVLPVLPEAVTGSEETQYGLAYGNMMGLVVEAIKELREEIKSIKSRL